MDNIDEILDELFDWEKVDDEDSPVKNNELVITKDGQNGENGNLSLFIVNRYRFILDKSKKLSENMLKSILKSYDYKYLHLADINIEFFK